MMKFGKNQNTEKQTPKEKKPRVYKVESLLFMGTKRQVH